MSAEALQKVIVESHRGAQNQLANFHSAMDHGNTKSRGNRSADSGSGNLLWLKKRCREDNVFWTEAGRLFETRMNILPR